MRYIIAGIDTGINFSLALVIIDCFFTNDFFTSLFFDVCKKRLSKILTPEKKKKIMSYIFSDEYFLKKFSINFAEVYNVKKYKNKTLEQDVYFTFSEKLYADITNNVSPSLVTIEDFLFFNLSKEKANNYNIRIASWYTVAKMQNFIGYLSGYLRAKGLKIKLVKPRSWKSIVNPYHEKLATKFEQIAKVNKNKRSHLISALGIALSSIPDVILSQIDVI